MPRGQLKTPDEILTFMLGGSATLTLQAPSGKHYTYKVKEAERKPDDAANAPLRWFVGLLSGPDNDSDYTYLGLLENTQRSGDVLRFRLTPASRLGGEAAPVVWVRRLIEALVAEDEKRLARGAFYHEGRCGMCNRKLTTPESIKRGIGPVCFETNNQGEK
jgi:hypothetical protein